MMYNVHDMYLHSISTSKKLLSDFNADYWIDYINNSSKYDALFNRMFYSFRYFMQFCDTTIDEVTTDFIADVYNHLFINSKKYSELYRVHVLADGDYSIINNYNVTERMDRDTTSNRNSVIGSRDSSSTLITGSQTSSSENKIAGFNSTDYSDSNVDIINSGERTDTSTSNVGSQNNTELDTGTEDYTLVRSGNIGIKTVSAVLKEHIDLWTPYEFYTYIFKEICNELLLV